jgi:D-cysteine desulfhydrase
MRYAVSVNPPLLDLLPHPPAHLSLGKFPSPVEEHPALATRLGLESLTIKRDDLNGASFGGNKLRALEWLLPSVGPAILTMGGYGSTWCAALAKATVQTGQQVHVAMFPQPWSITVAGALATTLAHGEVTLARSRWGIPLALARARYSAGSVAKVSWLPPGGATPLAVLGGVNAALEFVAQRNAPSERPDAIVVPLGSGGTAAGLLVGMWLAGWSVDICAVRVTDPWFANRRRVLTLARNTMRLLGATGARVSEGRAVLRIVGDQLGAGYGHPTAEASRARGMLAEAGITADLSYGAKAGAALAPLAASFRRLCFWHTFDARLTPQPDREHHLLRQARGYAETLWPLPKSI